MSCFGLVMGKYMLYKVKDSHLFNPFVSFLTRHLFFCFTCPLIRHFLFQFAKEIAPKVVMFLPRNVNVNQLAELALSASPPWSLEVTM